MPFREELIKGTRYHTMAFFKHGSLLMSTPESLPTETTNLLPRFAKVFEQTYTRFLDLQKAEAQAREGQIEGALERVRSRTMAMHRSEEIADILGKIFEELNALDVVLNRILIWIFNPEGRYISWWSANSEVEANAESYRVDYNEHPVFLTYLEAWQKQTPLLLYTISGPTKDSWEDHLFKNTELSRLPQLVQNGMRSEGTIHTTSAISDYGLLMAGSLAPLSDENTDIVHRFGRVFQQSYRRYLDVQRAEAQAREAQVETALERVRSRSMAMHKSDELIETATLLYQELAGLGIPPFSTGFVLVDENNSRQEVWLSGPGGAGYMDRFFLPLTGDSVLDERYRNWKNKEPVYHERVAGERLIEHLKYASSFFGTREAEEQAQQFPEAIVFYCGYFPEGYLHILTEIVLDDEQESIMKRFTQVFGMTYRRFLDLKNAEAQAREAQIEAALERVRSRSMAMQKSAELKDIVHTLSNEIGKLDVIFNRTFICILDSATLGSTWWMSNPESGESFGLFIKDHEHLPYQEQLKAWRERKAAWQYKLEGEDKKEWDKFLFAETDFALLPDPVKESMQSKPSVYLSYSFSNFGSLVLESSSPLSDQQFDVLSRFAKTFDQSYTRFLDIQKAEAQAREAQIEAALERLRSRSMAMHQSSELNEILVKVFAELKSLELEMERCVIWTYKPEDRSVRWWAANPEADSGTDSFLITDQDHPVYHEYWKAWEERRTKYLYILEGDNMVSWCDGGAPDRAGVPRRLHAGAEPVVCRALA
jgi:hypothetical protein